MIDPYTTPREDSSPEEENEALPFQRTRGWELFGEVETRRGLIAIGVLLIISLLWLTSPTQNQGRNWSLDVSHNFLQQRFALRFIAQVILVVCGVLVGFNLWQRKTNAPAEPGHWLALALSAGIVFAALPRSVLPLWLQDDRNLELFAAVRGYLQAIFLLTNLVTMAILLVGLAYRAKDQLWPVVIACSVPPILAEAAWGLWIYSGQGEMPESFIFAGMVIATNSGACATFLLPWLIIAAIVVDFRQRVLRDPGHCLAAAAVLVSALLNFPWDYYGRYFYQWVS